MGLLWGWPCFLGVKWSHPSFFIIIIFYYITVVLQMS